MLPTFETERLLVRPRSLADLDACLAMDRDPEVTKYIPGPWSGPVAHELFVRERMEDDFGDGLGYWSIVPKETGRFAGWVLLIPRDGVGPEIEIGWRLNRFAWGKGYATEAALPLVHHAFLTLGLAQIIAEIHADNAGSLHVARKIGMQHVGDGHYEGVPCKTYAMTAEDYRTKATHKRDA